MRARQIETELTDEEYAEFLTEIYGEVEVCGMTFDSGRILQELDPVAFRCGKSDEESNRDSENPRFACDECGDEYEGRGAEDEAEDCCKTACEECGELYEDDDEARECCTEDVEESEATA